MSDNSAIQWTDATWGPTLGCTKVSDGCLNCYAIRTAHRLAGNPNPKVGPLYEGLTRKYPDGSLNWTGKVRTIPSRLELPLTWTKPRRIFVDSQSDLFHEGVSDEFIWQVFGVMALAEQHTFQVLTKRPDRMRQLLSQEPPTSARGYVWGAASYFRTISGADPMPWPLPNVWLGVSAEDQSAADERIPLLLQTTAVVRFISAEPLLGPLRIQLYLPWTPAIAPTPRLDWVITGGESGPNHRPFHQDWARSIRDQCAAAGVAYLHKQNGGMTSHTGGCLLDGVEHNAFPEARVAVPA